MATYLHITVAADQNGEFAVRGQKMLLSLPGADVFTRGSYPREVQWITF